MPYGADRPFTHGRKWTVDEAPDTNDREEASDDLDAQQRRGVDQLAGPWSGTLRVILVAAAADGHIKALHV